MGGPKAWGVGIRLSTLYSEGRDSSAGIVTVLVFLFISYTHFVYFFCASFPNSYFFVSLFFFLDCSLFGVCFVFSFLILILFIFLFPFQTLIFSFLYSFSLIVLYLLSVLFVLLFIAHSRH